MPGVLAESQSTFLRRPGAVDVVPASSAQASAQHPAGKGAGGLHLAAITRRRSRWLAELAACDLRLYIYLGQSRALALADFAASGSGRAPRAKICCRLAVSRELPAEMALHAAGGVERWIGIVSHGAQRQCPTH